MATRNLNPAGAEFERQFNAAWKASQEGDQETAENMCRKLLMHPELGDAHKAGCHLILACGQDCYLEHAEQAVDLYENLYVVRPGSSFQGRQQPSEQHLKSNEERIKLARKVLAKAKKDHDEIQKDYDEQMKRYVDHYGRRPTDAQLVEADFEANREAIYDRLEAEDAALDEAKAQTDAANDEDDDEEIDIDALMNKERRTPSPSRPVSPSVFQAPPAIRGGSQAAPFGTPPSRPTT